MMQPWHAERAREQCEYIMAKLRSYVAGVASRQLSKLTEAEIGSGTDYNGLMAFHTDRGIAWFQEKLNGWTH